VSLLVALAGRLATGFAIDLAFEIPLGGVTAMLGPSGSGKTTVLRAIAGLVRLRGTVRLDNETWQAPRCFVPAEQRRIGFVFQGAGLLPHLTVAQNLAYAGRRAPSGPFDRARVIERTGIADLLDRRPARLSGGEAQRASLARTLLSQPRLLLLDEPLSALDRDAKTTLIAAIWELVVANGVPTIYVTHDEDEAARLSSRTVRLRNGSLDP
jgi:molybdate transport system ATP-binding protein